MNGASLAIVTQWQSTGGHNQPFWIQFPATTSFIFSLFMMFGLQFDTTVITHVYISLA